MRFRIILCCVFLLSQLPLLAQDSDFPTLDALAKHETPPFIHLDMAGRMSLANPSYTPPDNPPRQDIGQRETLRLRHGEEYDEADYDLELRAQTDRVVIWVQHDQDYPRWRAESLARQVETYVLDDVQARLKSAEPPGVDGDPRLIVVLVYDPDGGYGGYFARGDTLPRKMDAYSHQREMIVLNLGRDDEYDFFDEILIEYIAHEYTHALQHHSDFGEESWLDESLATWAGFHASKPFLSWSTAHIVAEGFLESPEVGLTQWHADDDKRAKYGAGFLFMMYLTQRFGDEIAPRLLAEQSNGWRSVVNALRDFTEVSADEVFADWVLANYFLDARRGYGYRELDADLTPPTPAVSLNSFPAAHDGELPQYATEYIALDVRGADSLHLRLEQDEEARLFGGTADQGGAYAYALPADYGNNRLTRAFNLDASDEALLEFRFWYNLARNLEYAFVTMSVDEGKSWQTLRGKYTRQPDVYSEYYRHGYTGDPRYWRRETIDLSGFAPGEILLGFELLSNHDTSYRGVAIDEIRIDAIDFHEDFESPDAGWNADGWIFTDNRLPNNTWLQVAQDTGDRLRVSRELVSGSGELTVDLLPGVSQALVAISPVTPQTGLPTEYQLEASLLNAAGDVLQISRECTVTTTDPLNFRAAPNGNKIGLLPKGTAVDALDRQGDWFQVDYHGSLGWVHGDYVTEAGNCP